MRFGYAYSVADGIFVIVNVDPLCGLRKQAMKTYVQAGPDCVGLYCFSMSSVAISYLVCHTDCQHLSLKRVTKDGLLRVHMPDFAWTQFSSLWNALIETTHSADFNTSALSRMNPILFSEI